MMYSISNKGEIKMMYENFVEERNESIFTWKQVRFILREHDADVQGFMEDNGEKETYTGEELYNWLGY